VLRRGVGLNFFLSCLRVEEGLPRGSQVLNVNLFFLFHFYANVEPNVTSGIYYYITTEFDYAKRDSGLAAYGGVVLQQFEFIKVCMRMQRLCLKSQLFLYFVIKIYLPCYCVTYCYILGM